MKALFSSTDMNNLQKGALIIAMGCLFTASLAGLNQSVKTTMGVETVTRADFDNYLSYVSCKNFGRNCP